MSEMVSVTPFPAGMNLSIGNLINPLATLNRKYASGLMPPLAIKVFISEWTASVSVNLSPILKKEDFLEGIPAPKLTIVSPMLASSRAARSCSGVLAVLELLSCRRSD